MFKITSHQGNANKNHNELYHLTAVRMTINRNLQITNTGEGNLQITNTGEGVEKREPSHTIVGNGNWCRHYGEQYA